MITIGLTLCSVLVTAAPVDTAAVPPQPQVRASEIDASSQYIFNIRWQRLLVRGGMHRQVGESFGTPAIAKRHQLVIVGTAEGVVQARALGDGELVWEYRYGTEFESSVTLAPIPKVGDVALVSSRDGYLHAIKVGTGERLWRVSLDAASRVSPTLAGDALVLTTVTNQVVALRREDGKVLWTRGRARQTGLSVRGHARATVYDDMVFASFSDGYVVAYSLADGTELWKRALSPTGVPFADADADPVVAGGRLFVASFSDGVYALNPKTGSVLWLQKTTGITRLAYADSALLVARGDGDIWGLALDDGRRRFRTKVATGPISRLRVDRGLVVLTAGDSGLVVLNASTGQPLQATALAGRALSDPAWEGTDVAVLSATGHLYYLSAEKT